MKKTALILNGFGTFCSNLYNIESYSFSDIEVALESLLR